MIFGNVWRVSFPTLVSTRSIPDDPAQVGRVRQPPIRVNIRGRMRTFVPEGLGESSPARSAGLAFLKSIRPGRGRDDRQMLAIAEPRAKSKAECFYRPYGTDLPFASFPSTSYWATFVRSLRDCFSLTTNGSAQSRSRALKLTHMGGCRTATKAGSRLQPPDF